jgi:hypothetical protein
MGALGLAFVALIATMGAQRPARRLKKLEIPVPKMISKLEMRKHEGEKENGEDEGEKMKKNEKK